MPKYTLQEMPDLNKSGERKVYPKAVQVRQFSNEDLVDAIHSYNSTFSSSTIMGVLIALGETIQRKLSEGYSVKLDEIGTFSLALEFKDEKSRLLADDKDQMGYRKVQVKDVNFKVDTRLLKRLSYDMEWERAYRGVRILRAPGYSPEERLQRAIRWIEQNGHISLQEYVQLNHISRSSASRELGRFCRQPDSPLAVSGRAPHRVWIKRK